MQLPVGDTEVAAPPEDQVELQSENQETDIESLVKNEELDPPMGIGLTFDEIEEMIDEVLESDDS